VVPWWRIIFECKRQELDRKAEQEKLQAFQNEENGDVKMENNSKLVNAKEEYK
jgi:hypothetical protein